MLLLIKADKSFEIQTGDAAEARAIVEAWPQERKSEFVSVVEWQGNLPTDRDSRDRWRWNGNGIVIVDAPESVAQQQAGDRVAVLERQLAQVEGTLQVLREEALRQEAARRGGLGNG